MKQRTRVRDGRFRIVMNDYTDEREDGVLIEYDHAELLPGLSLFAVYATYAKARQCRHPYYVAARTKSEARRIWRRLDIGLDVVQDIRALNDEEAREVLYDRKMSIF